MATVVYLLCALTSALCAFLLLRAYRRNHVRLLLWSGLCFVGLFLGNLLLVLDLRVFLDVDLLLWRNVTTLGGLLMLLYGLIWDTKA